MTEPANRSLPARIDHPCCWRGAELFTRPDWMVELTRADIDELESATKASRDAKQPLGQLDRSNFPLSNLGPRLESVQHSLEEGSGATMIRGLPVDTYDEDFAARMFWGLSRYIGTPVPQTADGKMMFHVRDERLPPDHPQARGPSSNKSLSFHTDRCDVIAFLCLHQADQGGENDVVSSALLFNELSQARPDIARTLMEPFLYQRHNVDPGNQNRFYEQPVFTFRDGHFAASILRVLIERAYAAEETPDMTDLQRESLDMLEQIASSPGMAATFRQQPGDLLFLNNYVTLHRRSAFSDPTESATRRHLLRLWLAVPNSRPLDRCYQAAYGNTEAGAIRGGMRLLK